MLVRPSSDRQARTHDRVRHAGLAQRARSPWHVAAREPLRAGRQHGLTGSRHARGRRPMRCTKCTFGGSGAMLNPWSQPLQKMFRLMPTTRGLRILSGARVQVLGGGADGLPDQMHPVL